MKNNIYGSVYKITNLVNNKIYIGQSVDPNKRWKRHKSNSKNIKIRNSSLISKAIYRYGEENFVFEIIESASSADDLNKLEEYYIFKYNSISPNGYNLVKYVNTIKIVSTENKFKNSVSKIHRKSKKSSSRYFGVSFDKKSQSWKSSINFNGKRYHLGYFSTEKDAAIARDIESLDSRYQNILILNFPELKDRYLSDRIKIIKNYNNQQGIKKSKSSNYIGVHFSKKEKKWRSTIGFEGKNYYLGFYLNEIDAAKAYDKKAIELYGENAKTNFE